MQPDFMPGGALPVNEGDLLVEEINAIMCLYSTVVATQDWHPKNHSSFASAHEDIKPFESKNICGQPQTMWPDHCVQGTLEAELHPKLETHNICAIIRKGMNPFVDSYSAFATNLSLGQRYPTGLSSYLRELGVTGVHICGLAKDYCVKFTALDAVTEGFKTSILLRNTRPVDSGETAKLELHTEFAIAGISLL